MARFRGDLGFKSLLRHYSEAMSSFVGRILGAIKLLARDNRIPKPLRWIAGFGLLPIPGPIDEAVLLLLAPLFLAFYREPLREAWRVAEPRTSDKPWQANAPADQAGALFP